MAFETLEITVAVVVAAAIAYLFSRRKRGASAPEAVQKKTLVDAATKYPFMLIEKEEISHDTRRFRFKLPTEGSVLGLPVGQHINLITKIDGELVVRSYTPTTSDDDVGFMDLIVKVYFKDVHPKFPAGGKMSQYLENLKIGDSIDVRGPSGKLQYLGNGKFSVQNLRNEPPTIVKATHVNMIAGGTGITPMLQLIRQITKTPGDSTKLALLYANQTERDILVRQELEQAQKEFPDQVKIWYTVDHAPEGWKYSTGFVTADMIKQSLFPNSADTFTLLCGPPPMIKFACNPNLDTLGYDPSLRFSY